MKFIKKSLKRFQKNEDGAALVEYAITMLVVILVGTGALLTLANDTTTTFGHASSVMNTIAGCTAGSTC